MVSALRKYRMAPPVNNLFLRLHKWASRQDENFLTESLVLVLDHLLVLAPAAGCACSVGSRGGHRAEA